MNQDEQSEQRPSVPASHTLRTWLLGSIFILLLLALALLVLAPYLIATDEFKQKVQGIVAEQTGGKVEYQKLELVFWPRPAIELHQVSLAFPEQLQGRVAVIRVAPALLPLLHGNLQLARIELDTPELKLVVPEGKPSESSSHTDALTVLEGNLSKALGPLVLVAPELQLHVSEGRLSVTRADQKLADIDGLTLQLKVTVKNLDSPRASLQGRLSALTLQVNGHQETITDLRMSGLAKMTQDGLTVTLEHLVMSTPALTLSGSLTLTQAVPGLTLELSGSDIDVDAARRLVLALSGDTSPTREIFSYLRGGQVPQLSFHTQGKTASEFGDLKNIRIEGRLQDGKVSIPEIDLNLTEVNGDVVIADGILQGSGLSTNLLESTGHDGTLKMGLSRGNDLFHLDLILSADLAHAQTILKRLVKDPVFGEKLDKVTNLQGNATGQLILGESLANIKARIDLTDLNLSADYQGLPYPIKLTEGLVSFAENQVALKNLSGSLGRSEFSGLASNFILEDALQVDISAGQFNLDLNELSPWLNTFKNAKKIQHEVSQPTDHQWLSSLNFKGQVKIIKGPDLSLDIAYQPEQLSVNKLKVKDQYSDFEAAFSRGQSGVKLNFTGVLKNETLEALHIGQESGKGRLEGDFAIESDVSQLAGAVTKGHLRGNDLQFQLPSGDKITIEKIALRADGSQIEAEATALSWNDRSWAPFKARVSFDKDRIEVKVLEARLCGINSPGLVTMSGKKISLDFLFEEKGLDVTIGYSCLTGGKLKMTGTMDFSTSLKAHGESTELVSKLQGPLDMTFSNGLIEQSNTITRVLEVLNVTEIVKGRLPDLNKGGFAYTTINIKGEFRGGKLIVEKLYMDGETLDVLGYGEIDIEQETVNFELLAAPFKTVDTVVKNIPGINYLLAGNLVTIPVSIKGSLADPKVQIMPVASVGSSLLRLGKDAFNSSRKLIDAIMPGGKNE